jgi:hypothetical protein
MNEPTPPPVTLETLGELAHLARPARRRRGISPNTIALGIAAGLLAWRLVPAAIRVQRRRSRLRAPLATAIGIAAFGLARWQMQRVFRPEPKHDIEGHSGSLEVRRYPSIRIAETTIAAAWEQALEDGLERLAHFFARDNDTHRRLRMGVPVLGTAAPRGFRLAIVVPDEARTPAPGDPRVSVSDVPPRRVAVLRFRGRRDAKTIAAKKRELATELARAGLKPHGEPFFAGYDPPSTLPILRRNELWIELDDHVSA